MNNSLDMIRNEIYLELESLFAMTAVDEQTDDIDGYAAGIKKIAAVAEALGVATVITKITIDLKQ